MNLSPTLAQFFSPAGLMTLISPAEAVKRGTKRVMAASLYEQGSSDSKNPVGTQVGFYRSTNNRDAARASSQTDPSRAVDLPGTQFITVAGVGGKENFDITPALLAALESPIPFMQQGAVAELQRNIQNFYSRFTELRTQSIHGLFANGAIWYDQDGNLLQSSAGAKFTYDPGIPTANKITKDGAGSTYNIGDWSNTATNIAGALRGIVQANINGAGYDLTTIGYGIDVPGYLANNASLQPYFKLNQAVNNAISLENTIPDGFLGFKWAPLWKAGKSASNTVTPQFAANFINFMPDVSSAWYELIPCGTVVPSEGVAQGMVTAAPTAGNATSMISIKYGFFTYGSHVLDPYTWRIIAGDYFVPALKVGTTYRYGTCS